MEHIKRKKIRYLPDGTIIGDLDTYKKIMQEYNKLRVEASAGLKPLGFEMISPREFARNKKPSLVERVTQIIAPPPAPNVPPAIPKQPPEDKPREASPELSGIEEPKDIGSKIKSMLRRLKK